MDINDKIESLKNKLKEQTENKSIISNLKIRPFNPLCISNKYGEVIFEINHKGEIKWMNEGELKKANVDSDLALAFVKVIEDLLD